MAGCGQVGDRGQTYAAKNFYDPVKNRTLLWTNADVHPNTTMTLLREMTYNLELQQLEFPPIEEQTQLREEVLASEKNVALPAGGGAVVLLGGKAGVGNQSESSRSRAARFSSRSSCQSPLRPLPPSESSRWVAGKARRPLKVASSLSSTIQLERLAAPPTPMRGQCWSGTIQAAPVEAAVHWRRWRCGE